MEDRTHQTMHQVPAWSELKLIKGIAVSKSGMKQRIAAVVCTLLVGLLYSMNAMAIPKVKSWTTANGIKVLYVHAPEIPIVDIQILFDAGSARDQKKKGLALLTNRMMSMGAGKLDATGIAEQFESIGAKFGRGALRDSAWLSIRTLSDEQYLGKAVETLSLLLNKPRFRKADLAREKKRILSALKQQQQSPAKIAKRIFYREVFRGHPYANMPIGTEAGVKSIRQKDLKQFYKKYYVGRNMMVAIVGAIDQTRARQLVERMAGQLIPGQPAPALPAVKALSKGKMVYVAHPSSQAHIYIGQPGSFRGDPDYFALYLANHPFGGSGLVSRLADEVREKRGLAYSVYSYFSPMRRKGVFMIGMQTKTANTAKAIALLRKLLKRYHEKGMTKKEFKNSVSNITGGFALRIDTNKKIVQYIGMIGFYGLPSTYLTDFNQTIRSLDRKQVNVAFRRRVNPEAMITVVVGGSKAPVIPAP